MVTTLVRDPNNNRLFNPSIYQGKNCGLFHLALWNRVSFDTWSATLNNTIPTAVWIRPWYYHVPATSSLLSAHSAHGVATINQRSMHGEPYVSIRAVLWAVFSLSFSLHTLPIFWPCTVRQTALKSASEHTPDSPSTCPVEVHWIELRRPE